MTVWQSYLQGWKRYVDFSGRSTRKEFWVFLLGSMLISVLLGFSVAIITTLPGTVDIFTGGDCADYGRGDPPNARHQPLRLVVRHALFDPTGAAAD